MHFSIFSNARKNEWFHGKLSGMKYFFNRFLQVGAKPLAVFAPDKSLLLVCWISVKSNGKKINKLDPIFHIFGRP
jgi:hypothetical protein